MSTLNRINLALTVALLFASLASTVSAPSTFFVQSKLLVIVKGYPQMSTQLGHSGKASLYVSSAYTLDGPILFLPVVGAQDVDVERRSTKDPENKSDYGKNGFVPPGIYFLHYHRQDVTGGKLRNRLVMSDFPGGERILATVSIPPVKRTFLEFHRAYNDLEKFKDDLSEGCVVLTESNFTRLFPDGLFDAAQSPLAPGSADSNPLQLRGSTDSVLVFVTDDVTPNEQDKQLQLFDEIRKSLKPSDFAIDAESNLPAYRLMWNAAPPSKAPAPPTGLQAIVK